MCSISYRHFLMLQFVPRSPKRASTTEILHYLEKNDFSVTQRSIQRDLNCLSKWFPDLRTDGNKDVAGWYWEKESGIQTIPMMSSPMAISFKLMEQFLKELIPPSVLSELKPYFDSADNLLNGTGMTGWIDKVRICPRTQPLIPAKVNPEVVHNIYQALFEDQRIRVRYRNRNDDIAEYELNPVGLVFRNTVSYLIATAWNYQDPRQYALHRFLKCELLDKLTNALAGFSLDQYIADGAFGYVETLGKTLQLSAAFDPGAAFHLHETPLSNDQTITEMQDGRLLIDATVVDSDQLRWWLRGFGEGVEILKPDDLRTEFIEMAQNLTKRYHLA